MAAPATYVALLRGINVGGKHKLPMQALVAIFEAQGCADVRTYIQSGNVVFGASASRARATPRAVAAAIAEQFGYDVPVVLRSAAALSDVADANPYLAAGADPKHCHVAFLGKTPSATALARLDPQRSPPDEFTVRGAEIYLRCPGGMARTKLTNAWFDRVLETTSTLRNWRTVLRLRKLCQP